MQNVGFVFSIYPALKKLYPDIAARRAAVSRNLELVNTHPSMGPLLMGLTVRLEKDREREEEIITYRRAVMTTLAAQGDHIFWGIIKPLTSVMGVLGTLWFDAAYSGPLLAILAYNIPNMALRSWGFGIGWSVGLPFLTFFQSRSLQRSLSWMQDTTACGLGVLVGVIICSILSMECSRMPMVFEIVEVWAILSAGIAGFFLLYRHVPLGLVMFLAAFGLLFLLASI